MIAFPKTLLLAGLAAMMLGAAAQAGEPETQLTRTVRHADLDLSTSAGAKAMARRIRSAANFVCGGDNRLRFGAPGFIDCRKRATARAASELGAPLVTAELKAAQVQVLSQR
jgi:UrcA family protein